MQRVYLDHAATSWPKPPGVTQAMFDYEEQCGAAAGRGSYASASIADQVVLGVRRKLAKLIRAHDSRDIALLANGTAALNMALAGTLKSGDHVVTTAAEHNSVLRPLTYLKASRGIEFTIVPTDRNGWVDPRHIQSAITSDTRLVAITHASNVTGCVQPIEEISMIAKRADAWFLVDAAQTLGYLDIDVQALGIDLLAAPGHKGACGPLGTGMLYASPRVAPHIVTPCPGGTGTISQQLDGPFEWPSGVEAGNANIPALAGWSRGLDWLDSVPINQRAAEAQRKTERLLRILRELPIGTILGHAAEYPSVGVVSLACEAIPCSDLAALLDSSFRVEVRSGLHCSAKIHDCLGTQSLGGTLRFSLGHTSTDRDLDALQAACESLRQSGI